MSYSRWIASHWYTFWSSMDDEDDDEDKENRDNAVFEICGVTRFTAKELRENLDKCMLIVHWIDPNGDIDELKIYVKRFLKDVDDEYPS